MRGGSIPHMLVKRCCGTAAIEFAVALIPLMLVIGGGITYSGVIAAQLALAQAANEGARAAMAGLSLCEREQLAAEAAAASLFLGTAKAAEIEVSATAARVVLSIRYPYRQAAILPALLPVPETLTARAVSHTDGPIIPAGAC